MRRHAYANPIVWGGHRFDTRECPLMAHSAHSVWSHLMSLSGGKRYDRLRFRGRYWGQSGHPLLDYRGQLACELLPAAIAADPDSQRAKLSALGMTTVATFDFQSSRINRHVPVHVDVNDFLVGRVGERIEGSPTLAQVGDSRVSRHAFASRIDKNIFGSPIPLGGRDVCSP